MIKTFDIRIAVYLAVNMAYIFMLATINSACSDMAALVVPALLAVSPALNLGLKGSIFTALISGLIWSASTTAPFGTVAVVMTVMAVLVNRLKIEKSDWSGAIAVLVVGNFATILLFVLLDFKEWKYDFFLRVLVDSMVSEVFLLLFGRILLSVPNQICSFILRKDSSVTHSLQGERIR